MITLRQFPMRKLCLIKYEDDDNLYVYEQIPESSRDFSIVASYKAKPTEFDKEYTILVIKEG